MNHSNTSNHNITLNKYYKLLAENTIECIWLFDLTNMKFKYISPAITNLIGLTVEESFKKKPEDFFTPKSMEKLKFHAFTKLPRFLAGDRSEEATSSIDEYQLYCKDGTIKTIEISIKFLLNEETKSVDVLGVSRDTTKLRKTKEPFSEVLNPKDFSLKNLTDVIQDYLEIKDGNVYCFGEFSVYSNQNRSPVKWRTSKSEELFAFLLHHGENGVSKWQICETLWPDYNSEKVDVHLHTTLYKMKKSLQAANIRFEVKFRNGCYWINPQHLYRDSAEFDLILSPEINITDATVKKYEKAFFLYRNDYLEGNDYIWALSKRELYSKKYCHLATALVKYYMQQNNLSAAERILLSALEKFPLEEIAHEQLLKIYFMKHDRVAFINHYHAMSKLFKAELGLEPSKAVKALYKGIEAH